jgi:acyl-coenzyme A thioesterase PaaI-like protein
MTERPSADQLLQRVPYARFLGMRVEGEAERFRAILPFSQHLIGNISLPALHGGVLGGFMEIAAVARLALERTDAPLPKPIDINIEYFRPAGPRETYATVLIRRAGRRVANVRVEAWQADPETPVAGLHGHFLLS